MEFLFILNIIYRTNIHLWFATFFLLESKQAAA